MLESKTHGLRAVKLTEVPIEKRTSAARQVARSLCRDGSEAADVLAAALYPSDRVYWVPRQAADELLAV